MQLSPCYAKKHLPLRQSSQGEEHHIQMLTSYRSLDILNALKFWPSWSYRAKVNFSLQYRDSSLGLLWPVLSLLAVTLSIGLIWGILLNKDDLPGYLIYLVCGFPIWRVISGSVDQGCIPTTEGLPGGMPLFTMVLERVFIVFLPFFYVLPVIFIAAFIPDGSPLPDFALLLLSFSLLVIWSVGAVSLLIALISLVPDLRHVITAVMRLAFLATPIIWEYGRLGEYQKYIWLNPFFVPLESLRSAFLGESEIKMQLLTYFSIYALTMLLLGVYALKLRANRIFN